MRRQSNDPTVLHSSIALLQERFRKLQKVKEMREERELLRVFTDAEAEATILDNAHYESKTWFIHPELIRPTRSLQPYPSTTQLKRHSDSMELQIFDTSLSIALQSDPLIKHSSSASCFNDTEVDTTLHL
ncbi:uncharacterized protein LOC120277249 [Dioscorea cayenensis subsp. rotundata]|uniref:Uncharacterized protein LOC120277249 n=1 Tax=Dioscorea cayennensis subsp. rotundata TaxID=55577 RepID=A0AB40CN04_DIOCR|nr:uncharacterized protein LOC120277249 [Dioscorea cayenensis subsp. rotundata]